MFRMTETLLTISIHSNGFFVNGDAAQLYSFDISSIEHEKPQLLLLGISTVICGFHYRLFLFLSCP